MLAAVLVQLIVIIVAARIMGWVFRRLHQPMVVGEIIGGIMLGPSCLQYLAPDLWSSIFMPEIQPVFQVIKDIGLMLLLLIVGMELEVAHLKSVGRTSWLIALAGLLVPFTLGMGLAPLLYDWLHLTGSCWALALFLGTALAITALPVLGRIMMELGIIRTRLGTVILSAAAVTDALVWILLSSIVAATQQQFSLWQSLGMLACTAGFIVVILGIVRPLLHRWLDRYLASHRQHLDPLGLSVLLVLLFASGWLTLKIGIFAEFGAFMLGVCLSGHTRLHHALGDSFRNFVMAFFLPIFFTNTGLNLDLGKLDTTSHWLLALLIVCVAITGKYGACTLMAHWNGIPWKESNIIGVMMNTRALMGFIVINLGYEKGILDKTLFTILVMMAIVTTLMTTPLLKLLYRGTELEEPIRKSGFFHPGRSQ